ncbi:phage tail tape measure protein [Acinetobacter pittii]|uniref:Phage tail tape measure protein n=1 Tax=Acinetobacter pittii TaxID=48296 RepID=A0AAE9M7N1_ACIPI|nr:phage tail tape measure protein [Acinetobacter pittii]AZP30392.1 phage tail tape measure protein [Acinetobacter pittii]USU93771.1 phage tail tape measure protein [Acinetobacter pittii]
MATSSLGRLTLDLLVKLGSFESGMNQAERKAKDTAKNMSNAFKGFSDQLNQSIGGTQLGSFIENFSTKLGSMRGGILMATAALSGMAVGGAAVAAGGLAVLSIQVAKNNVELARFAALANTSVETFQGLAGAAATYGITQEQLSDQLKDFNEKIGEFASVGGGEGKDFFEQIAVKTEKGAEGAKKLAEEMSKMDGVSALQLYVDKLQEAGLNQQQMSYYLESMGNDFTKLAPLLINGGVLWRDYQKAMEEAGIITGQEAIEKSIALASQTESLQMQFSALKNNLAQAVMPALSSLIGYFLEGSGKGGQFSGIVEAVGIAAKGASVFIIALSAGVKSLVQIIGGALSVLNNFGRTAINFVTASTFREKGQALVDGFNNNGKILVDTTKSVVENSKQAFGSISNIVTNQAGNYDKLTQSIINNRKAQLEWTKGVKGGVTSGLAQNKALNPTAKKEKAKKTKDDKSALEKAKREQERIENAQQSIIMQYADKELQIKLKYEEDKKKIQEAFANNPSQMNLYLSKAKETYERDVAAFKQAQREKYDSYKNDLLAQMADAQDAIALSSISQRFGQGHEYNIASMNVASRKAKDAELDAYTNNVNQINRDYDDPTEVQKRYELLEQAKATHIERMKALDVDYHDNARKLTDDQQNATLSMYGALLSQSSSVWGDMTQMIKDRAGEQSATYKAMFLMQQMFAAASALVSTHLAAAQVLADPSALTLPQKVAYSNMILGLGYANVGLIAAQTITGMAHDGIASVPEEGTWLLNKGERVLNPQDNQAFTSFINGEGRSGDVIINNYTSGKVETSKGSNGELVVTIKEVIDQYVPAQFGNPNSRLSKSVSNNFQAPRNRK